MMMTLNTGISPALLFGVKAKKATPKKTTPATKTAESKTPEQMAQTLQVTLRKVFSDVTVRYNPPYPPELPIAPDYPKGFFMVSLSDKSKAAGLDREPKAIQALKKIGLQEFKDTRYNPPVSYKFNDIHVVFVQRLQLH
jgi:hypothetical protein